MREQVIVLRVRYEQDDEGLTIKDAPSAWDWSELAGEDVVVVAAGPVVDVTA
jgi:hypothetical protein